MNKDVLLLGEHLWAKANDADRKETRLPGSGLRVPGGLKSASVHGELPYECYKGIPEPLVGKAVTPVGDRLFDILDEKDARPLEQERAITFHHTTAQLLFMAMRACWDTQATVAFLTTRVKAPDEDI
jgi:hypothetical protein